MRWAAAASADGGGARPALFVVGGTAREQDPDGLVVLKGEGLKERAMVAPPDGTVLGFGLAGGAELLPNGAPALASTVVVLTSAAELLRYDVGALGRAPSVAPHGREMATATALRPLVCVSLAAAGGGGRRPLRVLLAVFTPHAPPDDAASAAAAPAAAAPPRESAAARLRRETRPPPPLAPAAEASAAAAPPRASRRRRGCGESTRRRRRATRRRVVVVRGGGQSVL